MAFAAPEWEIVWIDQDEVLREWIPKLKSEEFVSVDTETVGWQTGNEKLCLVQIGVPSSSTVLLIDALSIKNLALLTPILSEPSPLVICHNASFEERQFDRHKISMRGVVDTLSMSRRLRPDLLHHSLLYCTRHILGLEISKEQQVSDWSVRPLGKEQVAYAALDAEITIKLYRILAEMDSKLEINPNLKVPDLMRLLTGTAFDRMALCEPIAPELALLNARYEMLRERIRTQLLSGEPSYEGEYGKASITKVKKTEVNPQKLKSEFPDIAPMVVVESVDKKRLAAVMKEYGVDQRAIDAITDIIGYTDRLNLRVGEE